MSRIYEALKRAEFEGTVPWSEQRSTGQSPLEGEDGETFAAGHTAAGIAASPVLVASASGVHGIARRPWNPSLVHLPALLNHGAAVEQFRSLRSRLFEFRNQHLLKSLLISSGLPQEGKSFVAANLAISLARQKDSKVLLVDGDMRHCTLHKLLGCASRPGLSDYLSGKASVWEIVQEADPAGSGGKLPQQILQNLAFIGGGKSGDEGADLSAAPRFAELIATLAPSFEWIIVDSSPVIPASDAVNLARACDGVLLVARVGVTQFQVAQRTQSELKASNILGFVLNGAEDAPMGRGYYESASPEPETCSE